MPYYVYLIKQGVTNLVKDLEKIDEFENYKEAKNFVKDKRSNQTES